VKKNGQKHGYWRSRAKRLLTITGNATDSLPTTHSKEQSSPDAAVEAPQNLSSYAGEHDVHEEVLSWLRPMADEIEEPYRSALIKADFEKISQRKLAREFGISESGLKSRVQRARKRLTEILQRCCEIEFGSEGRAVAFRRLRECHCDP
jgi:RNA polymerase sigma-70 factor, ECF subfamily